MADVAKSAVTILQRDKMGGRNGSYTHDRVRAKVVLSSQGGTTNEIVASAFDLSTIQNCSNAVTDGNTIYPAAPKYSATGLSESIIIADAANATAANHVNAADLTDTIYITVEGRKL
jgi:hypothetical protein